MDSVAELALLVAEVKVDKELVLVVYCVVLELVVLALVVMVVVKADRVLVVKADRVLVIKADKELVLVVYYMDLVAAALVQVVWVQVA